MDCFGNVVAWRKFGGAVKRSRNNEAAGGARVIPFRCAEAFDDSDEPDVIDDGTESDDLVAALRERLRWICCAMEIGGALVACWVTVVSLLPWWDRARFVGEIAAEYDADPAVVTPTGYALAFCIHTAAMTSVIVLLLTIFGLSRALRRGGFRDLLIPKLLKRIGIACGAMAAANVAQRPLIYALAWPELLQKAPLFTPRDVLLLLFSGFILVLAAVFGAGAKAVGEHRAFF